MEQKAKLNQLCKLFNLNGELINYKFFTSGHINTTCLVELENNGKTKKYVLQKINTNVFKKPEDVMTNISNVTCFIKDKLTSSNKYNKRSVLNFIQGNNGKYFVKANGEYWRAYEFIENSVTYDSADLLTLEETGKAFGAFQKMLASFPASTLKETLPNFHNTIDRYKKFEEVLKQDKVNRAGDVLDIIKEYFKLEQIATTMTNYCLKGKLPLRVTHNDTKCNNVLFDENTGKYLCVIDLDTVMPGLAGFDFGDAIRFGANTCAEDEKDTSKVKLDLQKFEAFTKGFLQETKNALTPLEIETLPLGALTMTTECGLRFLTDYLDGDNYFKTEYPEHNLVRAKNQLALAKDMVLHFDEMKQIVSNYSKVQTNNFEDSAV